MIARGLLWYDDDIRRPVPQKIADGVARYRERLGTEPTSCHLSTVHLETLSASRRARSSPLPAVQLVADDMLRPNYFLIGVEEGEGAPGIPSAPAPPIPTQEAATPAPARSSRRSRPGAEPASAATSPHRRKRADSSSAAAAASSSAPAEATPSGAARTRRPRSVPLSPAPSQAAAQSDRKHQRAR